MAFIKEDEFVPGAWNAMCDRCGRKRKSTQLRKMWNNLYVCEEHYEERHPQDFVRAKPEKPAPEWIRPDQPCVMVADACPTLRITGPLLLTAGVAETFSYEATGVLKDRTYVLDETISGFITPPEVVVGPGRTRGTFTFTTGVVGAGQVLRLVATDLCEASLPGIDVAAGGPPPVAGFYGLRAGSGTASFRKAINFALGNGTSSIASSPFEYAFPIITQEEWAANVGATTSGHFQDFESYYAIAQPNAGGLPRPGISLTYTSAANGVEVSLSSATGLLLRNEPPDANRNEADFGDGRFSTSYVLPGVGDPVPSDGGRVSAEIFDLTVTFNRPVAAFGFYINDAGDFEATLSMTASLVGGGSTVIPIPYEYDENLDGVADGVRPFSVLEGSVGFVGITADNSDSLFTGMTLVLAGGFATDYTAFDNLVFVTPEELPAARISLGDTIQFTDTSTGEPTAWAWNFGDGTLSTLQNPTKTYAAPGTYNVSLLVSNGAGSDSVVRNGYVVVT